LFFIMDDCVLLVWLTNHCWLKDEVKNAIVRAVIMYPQNKVMLLALKDR